MATAYTLAASAGASSSAVISNNCRIASLSIAAYDYLITIPAEIRLYKTTSPRSLGLILFVLIRYLSMMAILFSNIGYFYHGFSPNSCAHYGYLAPAFKVLQIMVSHAIMGVRTYNIVKRNRRIGGFLILAYIAVIVFEWVAEFNGRHPSMTNGNCVIATPRPDSPVSAWSFYLAAMLFDFFALSISTYHLLKAKANAASAASMLVNILLYDGLIYFVALTAVNMMNVFLYRRASHNIQSAGVSLAYAFVWILSQRILIHVREARAQQTSVIVQPPPLWNTSSSALRSDQQTKLGTISEDLKADLRVDHRKNPSEFDITVHIDKSVIRDASQPHGEEHLDRDPHATPLSVLDRSQDYHA